MGYVLDEETLSLRECEYICPESDRMGYLCVGGDVEMSHGPGVAPVRGSMGHHHLMNKNISHSSPGERRCVARMKS